MRNSFHLKSKRSPGDPSKIELSWADEEYFADLRAHDELMMVAGFSGQFTKPIATKYSGKKAKL